MNKQRDRKSPSPHSVAAIASLMVLVVGVGVGAYFVEFRGAGLQVLMAGAQAQEIMMLFGGMAVCALLTQMMVARAGRRPAAGQDNVRDMVRTVLELDPSEPDAMRKLESVPELHELAMMIAAEKNAKIEALQQVSAQRRDLTGLLKGMERSAASAEPLREEQNSEICAQIAKAWNTMLRTASMTSMGASELGTMQGPGSPEPGMVNLDAAMAGSPAPDPGVTDRVERVEASLEQLQRMVRELTSAPGASPQVPMQDANALFAPEPATPPVPESAHDPARDVTVDMGLGADAGATQEPEKPEKSYSEWNANAAHTVAESPMPPQSVEPLAGKVASGIPSPGKRPGMGDLPGMDDELPMSSSTPRFPEASPMPSEPLAGLETPAPEAAPERMMPSFGATPPQNSTTGGASPGDVSFGAPAESAPQPAPAKPAGTGAPAAPANDVDQEFAQHFPHFVGQPVPGANEPVEVTYASGEGPLRGAGAPPLRAGTPSARAPQGQRPTKAKPVMPNPAEALDTSKPDPGRAEVATSNPRQFPESQVIDLRSLGAVEFED